MVSRPSSIAATWTVGKARIQVDGSDVTEPQPSQFQRPDTGGLNGRRPMQPVAVGDGRRVVGVGASSG